ncbi:MAG TPA: TonB-dependent receptor plug domain-containing protein, partial [Chloroflexota bacterium]|nr:TonB-dependent receptor plug domain-containing protein [Chloroflexota bacterium]
GLMENQGLEIRGFQDGQYNVTFDGIPWYDSNTFTHHTTSYFMTHDLNQASVDRGPGTASTIGDATFGGTVSLTSKDPLDQLTLTPYTSFGSFNTQLYGAEFDTGAIDKLGGATAFLDGERLTSDGYLTNAGQTRDNFFGKFIRPIGDNTVLTVVAMYNQIHQYVPLGATMAQIQQNGPNFGLSSDPTRQDYFGYNQDYITSDFEYVGVKSNLGDGWTVDNKAYTDAYYHHGNNGLDLSGLTANGTKLSAADVPGAVMKNDYRSFGDVLRFTKDLPFGDVQTGIWYDHQTNSRDQYEVDWSQGGAYNPINKYPAGSPLAGQSTALDRLMHDSLDTV